MFWLPLVKGEIIEFQDNFGFILAINGTLHWSWYKLHFYMEGAWCIFKTWGNHTMYNNYLDLEYMCFCTEMKFYGQYFTDSCTCILICMHKLNACITFFCHLLALHCPIETFLLPVHVVSNFFCHFLIASFSTSNFPLPTSTYVPFLTAKLWSWLISS